mmetsp:Transcript_42570/g.69060  ORF Transcript_42570/g.69060 Transcript_42570/m.69060 type:complete len:220 (-) Transcript_42570:61-720(-)
MVPCTRTSERALVAVGQRSPIDDCRRHTASGRMGPLAVAPKYITRGPRPGGGWQGGSTRTGRRQQGPTSQPLRKTRSVRTRFPHRRMRSVPTPLARTLSDRIRRPHPEAHPQPWLGCCGPCYRCCTCSSPCMSGHGCLAASLSFIRNQPHQMCHSATPAPSIHGTQKAPAASGAETRKGSSRAACPQQTHGQRNHLDCNHIHGPKTRPNSVQPRRCLRH